MKDTKKTVVYMDDRGNMNELTVYDSREINDRFVGIVINEFGYEEIILLNADDVLAVY